MPNELPISLIIEWKAFTNAQFGRNLTFKTREIYKRAEKIFFSVVPTVIDGWPERKGVVTEEEVHRVLVKQFAGATKKKYRLEPRLSEVNAHQERHKVANLEGGGGWIKTDIECIAWLKL